jgi:hypothetical protein
MARTEARKASVWARDDERDGCVLRCGNVAGGHRELSKKVGKKAVPSFKGKLRSYNYIIRDYSKTLILSVIKRENIIVIYNNKL